MTPTKTLWFFLAVLLFHVTKLTRLFIFQFSRLIAASDPLVSVTKAEGPEKELFLPSILWRFHHINTIFVPLSEYNGGLKLQLCYLPEPLDFKSLAR